MRIADHIENAELVYSEGHVYKVLRCDGRYSAVHVFPFQLSAERYIFFEEQVTLLKEAYFEYNAAVPRVLGYGLTKNGSFPFIEMEWIEGHDLYEHIGEVKILSVSEVGKIAEEVSRALAACHNLGLVHSEINRKNILWDSRKQRYMLTGFRFGLNVAKEKLKTTGSIAAITPERRMEGSSQQTDVSQLGSLLLHVLAGKQKQLKGNWQQQRHEMLPPQWPQDRREKESFIPAWLQNCLEKAIGQGDESFHNAGEMYQYILVHHKTPVQRKEWYRSEPQQYIPSPAPLKKQWTPVGNLKAMRSSLKLVVPSYIRKRSAEMRFVFDRNIAVGLIIAALLTGFSIYAQKRENEREKPIVQMRKQQEKQANEKIQETDYTSEPVAINDEPPKKTDQPKKTAEPKKVVVAPEKDTAVALPKEVTKPKEVATNNGDAELGAYKVKSKAYFHNQPDESTRRNAFIVHWNNAVLRPLKEENDFVYIIFTNQEGQTSKGWLRKKDLVKQ